LLDRAFLTGAGYTDKNSRPGPLAAIGILLLFRTMIDVPDAHDKPGIAELAHVF
jgi:hypothetical protein